MRSALRSLASLLLAVTGLGLAGMTLSSCESATDLETPFVRSPDVVTPIESSVSVSVSELIRSNVHDKWLWGFNISEKSFKIDTADGAPICTIELELEELPANAVQDDPIALKTVKLKLDQIEEGQIKTCYSTWVDTEAESYVDLDYLLNLTGQPKIHNHLHQFDIEMIEREMPTSDEGKRHLDVTFSTMIDGPHSNLQYEVTGTISLTF